MQFTHLHSDQHIAYPVVAAVGAAEARPFMNPTAVWSDT